MTKSSTGVFPQIPPRPPRSSKVEESEEEKQAALGIALMVLLPFFAVGLFYIVGNILIYLGLLK